MSKIGCFSIKIGILMGGGVIKQKMCIRGVRIFKVRQTHKCTTFFEGPPPSPWVFLIICLENFANFRGHLLDTVITYIFICKVIMDWSINLNNQKLLAAIQRYCPNVLHKMNRNFTIFSVLVTFGYPFNLWQRQEVRISKLAYCHQQILAIKANYRQYMRFVRQTNHKLYFEHN